MKSNIFKNGTYLALLTALISGFSIFINKFAVTGLENPVLFSGVKNIIVALFLVGVLIALKKQSEIRELTKQQWRQLSIIGLIGGAVPFALFFTGLAMIPAINGAMIHKTLFIWVAILAAFFLKERFSLLQWVGVGTLFLSNLLIGGFVGFSGGVGELLILGATILWAIENILAKKVLYSVSSSVVSAGRMVFGSVFLGIFLAVSGELSELFTISAVGLVWILFTAFFLFGYVLTWYTALKHAPASYVAAILVSSTLITNLLSVIFITGTISEKQIVSGLYVILGTVLIIFYAKQSTQALGTEDKLAAT